MTLSRNGGDIPLGHSHGETKVNIAPTFNGHNITTHLMLISGDRVGSCRKGPCALRAVCPLRPFRPYDAYSDAHSSSHRVRAYGYVYDTLVECLPKSKFA